MKIEPTFEAKIMLGLKEGYDGSTHYYWELIKWLREYCNTNPCSVTMTPTNFIYKGGAESGAIIGLNNYPRFPATKKEIALRALKMASELKKVFHQHRVSVVCDNFTYLIEDSDLDKTIWEDFLNF